MPDLDGSEGALDRDRWASQLDLRFGDLDVQRVGDPALVASSSGEQRHHHAEHVIGDVAGEVTISLVRVVEADGTWLIGSHSHPETTAPS